MISLVNTIGACTGLALSSAKRGCYRNQAQSSKFGRREAEKDHEIKSSLYERGGHKECGI